MQKLSEEAKPVAVASASKLQAPTATPLSKIAINRSKLPAPQSLNKNLSGSRESLASMKSDRSSVFSASASQASASVTKKPGLIKPKMGTGVPNTPATASTAVKKPPVVQPVLQVF